MYPIRANKLALALAWALVSPPLAANFGDTGTARFSLPLVDVVPNAVGMSASYVIWTSTDSYLTPGTAVTISFPAGTVFPATAPLISNPSRPWVYMKFTDNSITSRFSPNEVTVTGGVGMDINDRSISITMPAAVYPGKLYIRFDKTYSGIRNPPTTGTAQVIVYDPSGEPLRSSQYFISTTYSALADSYSFGTLSGTVRSNGVLLPGALVMARTAGAAYHPVSSGPRASMPDMMETTNNSFTTMVQSDGRYIFNIPSGTYELVVRAWRGVTMTADIVGAAAATARFVSSTPISSIIVSPGLSIQQDITTVPTFTP